MPVARERVPLWRTPWWHPRRWEARMWVLLVATAAGGVLREVAHPFSDDGVEAIVKWIGLCVPGCVIAYVVVGRWMKGLTTLWKPSWREFRRILVAAPLGVLALRLLIEDDDGWLWLLAGGSAALLALAVARWVAALRERRRRTNAYGTVSADPYAERPMGFVCPLRVPCGGRLRRQPRRHERPDERHHREGREPERQPDRAADTTDDERSDGVSGLTPELR